MKAVRIHRFGSPDVIACEDVSKPQPGAGEVVVRVSAAGVGPWDALVRSGRSVLPQPLPLTLGAELSGVLESIGPGVERWQIGDEVFGATSERFTGGHAEFAAVKAGMLARKPKNINYTHAASVPIAAVTAWQALEHAQVAAGQSVLIHGAAGNVGAYAVQLARQAGALVIATANGKDTAYLRDRGAIGVIDYRATRFEERVKDVDAVIDTVGGDVLERSYAVLKRGGVLISAAAAPDAGKAAERGVRAIFFLVQVTSERLQRIATLIESEKLKTEVGEVLWLDEARKGHEMLAGAPHRRGKIVIKVGD